MGHSSIKILLTNLFYLIRVRQHFSVSRMGTILWARAVLIHLQQDKRRLPYYIEVFSERSLKIFKDVVKMRFSRKTLEISNSSNYITLNRI